MKTIKESVLTSTKSGRSEYKLESAKKLVDKLNDKLWSGENGTDLLGRKLEIGDIVIDRDHFSFWYVSLIDERDVLIRKLKNDTHKLTVCTNLIKIYEPEKYLK